MWHTFGLQKCILWPCLILYYNRCIILHSDSHSVNPQTWFCKCSLAHPSPSYIFHFSEQKIILIWGFYSRTTQLTQQARKHAIIISGNHKPIRQFEGADVIKRTRESEPAGWTTMQIHPCPSNALYISTPKPLTTKHSWINMTPSVCNASVDFAVNMSASTHLSSQLWFRCALYLKQELVRLTTP